MLNGQNQLFNGLVSLISTQSVAVFADYQLLAAMGGLIEYIKAPPPADAAPLPVQPFGLFPTEVAPVLLHLPKTGSEPLKVERAAPVPVLNFAATTPLPSNDFSNRWAGINPVNELVDAASKWQAAHTK